jgi:hypothetical protein
MRNKLPILLALILMTAAAMPWLRSLESQRWSFSTRTTTVPPPEHPVIQAISAGSGVRADVAPGTGPIPVVGSKEPNNPPGKPAGFNGSGSSQENRLSGESSKTADNSSPPRAQALVESAVRTVENRTFISARVKQQGELFGHQIAGEGRYYELRQGPIPLIRFELAAEIGSTSTNFVQDCDGKTFWTYRKLPSGETLSKIDAVRAISAVEKSADKLPREAITSSPGLGGLGRLVRGLNAQFEFTSVVADQLGGLPVWKLTGRWRPAQLALLLPSQKDAIEKGHSPDLARLPPHVPDSVLLFLGQDDCFPFRIDYLRSVPRSSPKRLVGLEFFELNFNGPIDAGQFLFTPGSQEIVDHTEEFVRSLGGG